jgi:Flp pilus assembly protein TadG
MRRLFKIHRRFMASTRGVAAIEFAMILPVMAVLFLATFDGGRALAVYMKMRAATFALASISNQFLTIDSTITPGIVIAVDDVMAPYTVTSSNPALTISQIAISAGGAATYSWSYSYGGSAHAQGTVAPVPTALLTKSTYLIFAEVSYTFTPLFGYFTSAPITFTDNLYVTPRASNCINYPPESVTGCTS